ncbi:MAG: O-antigen/teichoic acid export membrane protein [Parvicella sp.]|jgi:O-antigen/teichoic acid export membrane protein
MQKKFLSNLILVLFLNVLIKPFYILGIDAEFLRQLPGDYGEYFSIISLTFIFNIFLDFGITNYNTREIAQNESALQKHFSSILTLRFLLAFVFLAIIGLSGLVLGYSEHQFKLLALLGVNQILVAFILFFRSNLAGLMLFKSDSIISVLDRTLMVVIGSLILWTNLFDITLSIELFIGLQMFAYAITAIISGLLVFMKSKSFKFEWDLSFFKILLKKSIPYALLILLMTFYYRVDSVMLEQMLPNGHLEATLYAQGYRFFEAFTMLGYLFAGLLLPIFSAMLAKKENVSKLVNMSLKLILAISITIGVTMITCSENIMLWRFDNSTADLAVASESFKYLMICFVAMTTTYIYGTLLTSNGSLRLLNQMAIVGVILNFGLNWYLIPKYGAIGAAQASAVTQVLTAVIQIVIAFKVIKLKMPSRVTFEIFAFSIILITTAYFVWDLRFIYKVSILISEGLLLSILLRMVDLKEGMQLLKKNK